MVALHLLRLRAQADLTRRVAADRLRGALSGNASGADEWLPAGPWRVVALGAEGSPERLLDLWESVLRRNAWNQPLVADLDERVYAVVRDGDGASPGTWGWLREVVAEARRESLALTARAGRTAHQPSELARSRAEAVEADRLVAPDVPVVEHERLWAQVTVARAAAALPSQALGPLQVLQRHDAEHGSTYLATLAAWLDHPGAPTAAAGAIHVHPNTLRYRMARIADLAGLDLTDPVVRLATRLQLVALVGQGSSQ